MAQSPPNTDATESTEQQETLIHRITGLFSAAISAALGHRLLVVVLAIGTLIIVVGGVTAVRSLVWHDSAEGQGVTLQSALDQLDAEQYDEAKRLAMRLQKMPGTTFGEHGGPLFVLGAVLAHEAAGKLLPEERTEFYLLAARLLEAAETEGFPESRRGQALYLLGESLYHSGNTTESLPALLGALNAGWQQTLDIHRLLTSAYFHDRQPQLDEALRYNELVLADRELPAEQRIDVLLHQARIFLAMHDLEACHKVLAEIEANSDGKWGPAWVVKGKLLMQEAERAATEFVESTDLEISDREEKYGQAIEAFRRAQGHDQTGESSYLIGVCYRALDDRLAAERAFARTWRMHFQTPESLAARLAEGELQQRDGRYGEARESLLAVIESVGDLAVYENQWVSLDELSARLVSATKRFLDAEQFETAVEMTAALQKVLPDGTALEAKAEAHEAWGESLLRLAFDLSPGAAEGTRMLAREQFRLAGLAYEQLAGLRYATRRFSDDLWKSGSRFLRGQNYVMAVQKLRQFLQYTGRRNYPRGLIAIGEAQLALGHYEEALQAFRNCIDHHPRHPATYQARLEASEVLLNLGRIGEAKELLADNLHNESLTPLSLKWQKSLFSFGQLLFREAMLEEAKSRKNHVDGQDKSQRKIGLKDLKKAHELFQESIRYLDEAVQRYPDVPQAVQARYSIAQSLRYSGRYRRKAIPVEPTQTRRNALARQMREDFKAAASSFLELQQYLNQKQKTVELTEIENAILRNTYFAYGDTLFDLGDYEAAIGAYSDASNRYQHRPEAIEAFVQIASCYRRTDAIVEARGTLMQAASLLKRIPPDADFEKTTRYSRDEWTKLLGWLSQL